MSELRSVDIFAEYSKGKGAIEASKQLREAIHGWALVVITSSEINHVPRASDVAPGSHLGIVSQADEVSKNLAVGAGRALYRRPQRAGSPLFGHSPLNHPLLPLFGRNRRAHRSMGDDSSESSSSKEEDEAEAADEPNSGRYVPSLSTVYPLLRFALFNVRPVQ